MECDHEEAHALAAKRAKDNMPTNENVESLSSEFKAISEPSRLKRSEEHTSELQSQR